VSAQSRPPGPGPDIETGTAGASARREHERRRANRERRVREQHPRTGGLRLAWREAPTHETVWARGAGGEELVAASLAARLRDEAIVLHDRRIPRSRANIDHIAIAPSGVWVIDTKRYSGRVTVHAPVFGSAKLLIAGRDQTKLIGGLEKQVALVRDAVSAIASDVPVHGALCIVEADLPFLGTTTFRGFPLLYPRALAKRINRGETLAVDRIRATAAALAERFPTA
jgi:hypothetical protein